MVTLNVLTKIVTPTITLLTKQLECNAIGRKYKIRRDTSCNSKNVIHVAYCIKWMKQGVGLI